MAGITDIPTRLICKKYGADLAFAEMVSAKGLEYNSQKTKNLFKLAPTEDEIGIQLFGHDPKTIALQAYSIEQKLRERLAYIDINMGCPVKKIVSKGDGCALMLNPQLASEIVETVKKKVSCKVTAKFRRGFYLNEQISTDFAHIMQESGADAICIHGRYAMQMYKGKADWNCIREAKEKLSIPIIANGDVKTVSNYIEIKNSTKADAIMIARAAISNPLLFSNIKKYLKNKNSYTDKSSLGENIERNQIINIALEHIDLCEKYYKKDQFSHFRKHAMKYAEGLKGAKSARIKICQANDSSAFRSIFEELKYLNE